MKERRGEERRGEERRGEERERERERGTEGGREGGRDKRREGAHTHEQNSSTFPIIHQIFQILPFLEIETIQ